VRRAPPLLEKTRPSRRKQHKVRRKTWFYYQRNAKRDQAERSNGGVWVGNRNVKERTGTGPSESKKDGAGGRGGRGGNQHNQRGMLLRGNLDGTSTSVRKDEENSWGAGGLVGGTKSGRAIESQADTEYKWGMPGKGKLWDGGQKLPTW